MIVISNEYEFSYLFNRCDGRCSEGDWCIFSDGTDNNLCPIAMDNIVISKENYKGFLEVGAE